MWGLSQSAGSIISTDLQCQSPCGQENATFFLYVLLISGKQPDTGTAFCLPHADYAAGESSSMLLSKALHSLFYSSFGFLLLNQTNFQCSWLIQSSVIVGTLLLTPFVLTSGIVSPQQHCLLAQAVGIAASLSSQQHPLSPFPEENRQQPNHQFYF